MTHYAAGETQPRHAHDERQVSFLLAGRLREELGSRAYTLGAGWRGCKPAGEPHSDAWGNDGALIFTLRFDEDGDPAVADTGPPGWLPLARPAVAALVGAFVQAPDAAARAEATTDLLALEADQPRDPSAAPRWLDRVRRCIEEEPAGDGVAGLAAAAGVHRGQLSRLFRRHYGVAPSVYRRHVRVARAARLLIRGEQAVAAVATEAGFFDQAHLTRVLRQDIGLAPGALRRQLAATSVQSRPDQRMLGSSHV